MDKGVLITREYLATYETITFLDEESKSRFLKKIYFDNKSIPMDSTNEQLEKLMNRVLYVDLHNTYIKLGISDRALYEILEKEGEPDRLGVTELIVELDNIPLVYKDKDYAKIYNIKLGPQNVVTLDLNDIDEEDIEEMKRRAFASKVDAVANERFKDYR